MLLSLANGLGIQGLIEKPDQNFAPSNLASIGRYILAPDIFYILRGLSSGINQEIQLADAIDVLAGLVEIVNLNGKRFDCGSVDGLLLHQFMNILKEMEIDMIFSYLKNPYF